MTEFPKKIWLIGTDTVGLDAVWCDCPDPAPGIDEQGVLGPYVLGADEEIDRLRQRVEELEAAKKLCRSDFEKWISNPPYEHMCDRNSAESAWPGQYKRYETQLAWEAWQQALSIDAAMAETGEPL